MPEQRREEIVDGELVSTIDGWYEVVTKDAEGEAHIHRLQKHSTKTRPAPEDIERVFVTQAPPVKISPTRRQKPEGDFETLLFYGDTHHPFQDERAMNLAQLAVREYMPDAVTFLGDDTDMALFSTFEHRPEWRESTQKGIDQFSERLAQIRADIGRAALIVAIEGNHDMRFAREIRKYNAELLGIKRANTEEELGVLTLDFLLRCDEIGVEYVSGYPEAEYWYSDNLKAYHGRKTASGSVLAKELPGETVNFIHGHGHSFEHMEHTFRDGRDLKTIWGVQLPAFATQEHPSGSYSRTNSGNVLRQAHNDGRGLGLVRSGEEGDFFQYIPITDDGIMIEGKWYKS